jgi:hypothetical protein
MDAGRDLQLDPRLHPHLDHGYAVTSHSSQGQTADRVLIHVDTELGAKDLLNNRMAYVAVSRGAYDAQFFTNDREKLGAALGHDVSHQSAHAPEVKQEPREDQTIAPQREAGPQHRRSERRYDVLRPIRHIHQELRYVREAVYERPLFLSLDREAPDPLIEPFGHVEIAVQADRKAGRSLELAVDYHACLELAAQGHFGDVVSEDAAGTCSANVERLAVQDEVHGLRELLPLDVRHESPRLYLEDLDNVPCLVGHVEKPAVHDDPAHRVAGPAVLVEHYLEALRWRHVQRRAVAHFGKLALGGGDQRTGKEVSVGETLAEVERHRRGLARLRQDGNDGVGVLARDVQAAVVAELNVEGVDHRRNVLGCHHYLGEVEPVTVAAVPGDMAVLAPGVGNVEIVADQCEAAGNVQWVRIGRRIEKQGMLLAGSAIILEDADVFDAGLTLTSVADPPHGVLPRLLRRFPKCVCRARTNPSLEDRRWIRNS